jgi:hypothetical protein
MNKHLIVLVISLFINACGRIHKSDNFNYFQDFESIKGWVEMPALSTEIKGHSGNYSILTNAQFDYSPGFTCKVKELDKSIKKIRASVWCYSADRKANGSFCIQIVNPLNQNILWVDRLFVDFIKSENSWTKTVMEADIPKEALEGENTLKVFLWNKGKIPVYGDDMEVVFSE